MYVGHKNISNLGAREQSIAYRTRPVRAYTPYSDFYHRIALAFAKTQASRSPHAYLHWYNLHRLNTAKSMRIRTLVNLQGWTLRRVVIVKFTVIRTHNQG